MSDWQNLPEIRNDQLLFQDTVELPQPGQITACLLCTKPFVMAIYSGEPDQICAECWTTYQDAARIICVKCRVTICRAQPKVLDNGFVIRPRTILHVDACNVCRPGLKQSSILEIASWETTMRPPKIIITGTGR